MSNSVKTLIAYRESLATAADFEEYRTIHLKWIDLLIAQEALTKSETIKYEWVVAVNKDEINEQ